jgi:hypothetical protein
MSHAGKGTSLPGERRTNAAEATPKVTPDPEAPPPPITKTTGNIRENWKNDE